MDRISVIIPTYNNAPWLERSLDSVISQTYSNIEIIVVNDGSSDNTREVLNAYVEKNPGIKVIHKENGGVTSARLQGIAEATGEWIGFMDADDYVDSRMYEQLLKNACSCGADISHCAHRVCFPDGRIERVHATGKIEVQESETGLKALLNNEIEGSLCLKLYHRKLFNKLEQWMDHTIRNNEDFLMNYYLFSRADTTVFEGTDYYHYILRRGSASYSGANEHSIFDPIRARRIILERCPLEMKDTARSSLMRNLLFAYAQVTTDRNWRNLGDFRNRIRSQLKEEQIHFHLLSLRNRVLANMVCNAPWLFHIAYKAYVAVWQRQEQH